MRHRMFGGALLAVAALTAGALPARAQVESYQYPGLAAENVPIPTGSPGGHGFYTALEFMLLTQTRGIGDQTVAFRGLVDSQGQLTGLPGTYIGSGATALTTAEFGRNSYTPGFNATLGYKLDNGVSVYGSYTHMQPKNYNASASLVAPFFRVVRDLSDTFLVSGVYNFPPQFAGPALKTQFDDPLRNGTGPLGNGQLGTLTYGIWNGASVMNIQFQSNFNQFELGARVPMFQTDFSRIYGLGGFRFNWFMERFKWQTIDYDLVGNESPRWQANYTNTLSQRMYGPFVGCGHEVYLGKRFSVSLDTTAAALIDLIKERAKYELGDNSIQNKRSRNDYHFVPSFTAHLNLWWYPIEGVQMRAGYNAWTFFNTKNMQNPIGFNYGAIDPVYNTQAFRLVHGLNFGVGLFF